MNKIKLHFFNDFLIAHSLQLNLSAISIKYASGCSSIYLIDFSG
nr:hypothetical protein [Romboutsia ilealis]